MLKGLTRPRITVGTWSSLLLFAAVTIGCSSPDSREEPRGANDPKNATYTIEGRSVTLTLGFSQVEAAPGSASRVTTRYFGNEASGDLNGDGTTDIAFFLTQKVGDSGTFYYVAVALQTGTGYAGTNAVLLGDRVVPAMMEIRNGEVIANYWPSPGPAAAVSKVLRVIDGRLVEQ